jgi:hypothetical protein
MDFITVVYRDELDMLPVQAKSIELYAHNIPETIWVVVNDDESVAYEIDRAWWGTMQDRVRVRTRRQYLIPDYGTGWDSQQLCKLVCGMNSSSDWSLVFDAKTWFVKDFDPSLIFDGDRINVKLQNIQEPFRDGWNFLLNRFGIEDPNCQPGPSGVPYIFNTEKLKSLRDWIKKHEGRNFIDWYIEYSLYPTLITEFLTYASWIYFAEDGYDKTYTGIQNWEPINIARDEYEMFEEKLNEMNQSHVLTASIHRDVFKNLTEAQLQQWRNFLVAKRLA